MQRCLHCGTSGRGGVWGANVSIAVGGGCEEESSAINFDLTYLSRDSGTSSTRDRGGLDKKAIWLAAASLDSGLRFLRERRITVLRPMNGASYQGEVGEELRGLWTGGWKE